MPILYKKLLWTMTLCASFVAPATTWADEADQAEAVKGNNAFAVDLYGQLKNQPGNLFFSPESISTALAMTYAGARADTASEMANTLHFTLAPEKLHAAMGALLSNLNAAHDGYQLKVANALWGQQGNTFLDDFLKLTKNNYGAGFNTVNFKGTTEAARQTINRWVEQRTENKIKDLIAPAVLTPRTRLVLTNAIYFNGDWDKEFYKLMTQLQPFYTLDRQTIRVPTMYVSEGFKYLNNGLLEAVEIPYRSHELSMIVFLPKDRDGLPALEKSLTESNMTQWLNQLQPVAEVIVHLPKFNIQSRFSLVNTLAMLGMKQAFGTTADFSGISSRAAMKEDSVLYISEVIHNAYVDVNEQGTEAAAATGMPVAQPVVAGEIQTPNFRADHPFVFLIRDNRSGGILFMGRVTDPTK
jgi:serpin B